MYHASDYMWLELLAVADTEVLSATVEPRDESAQQVFRVLAHTLLRVCFARVVGILDAQHKSLYLLRSTHTVYYTPLFCYRSLTASCRMQLEGRLHCLLLPRWWPRQKILPQKAP